jgi:hypothetical protein
VAPLVFFPSFAVLESVGKAAVGEAGPSRLADEVGILATVVAWLAIGLLLLREAASHERSGRGPRPAARTAA